MVIIQSARTHYCVRNPHLETCRDDVPNIMDCPQGASLTSGKRLTSILVIVTEIFEYMWIELLYANRPPTIYTQMRQSHPKSPKAIQSYPKPSIQRFYVTANNPMLTFRNSCSPSALTSRTFNGLSFTIGISAACHGGAISHKYKYKRQSHKKMM